MEGCYLYIYNSLSLYAGHMSQDLQWVPETKDSTEPYIQYVSFPIYIHTYNKV